MFSCDDITTKKWSAWLHFVLKKCGMTIFKWAHQSFDYWSNHLVVRIPLPVPVDREHDVCQVRRHFWSPNSFVDADLSRPSLLGDAARVQIRPYPMGWRRHAAVRTVQKMAAAGSSSGERKPEKRTAAAKCCGEKLFGWGIYSFGIFGLLVENTPRVGYE